MTTRSFLVIQSSSRESCWSYSSWSMAGKASIRWSKGPLPQPRHRPLHLQDLGSRAMTVALAVEQGFCFEKPRQSRALPSLSYLGIEIAMTKVYSQWKIHQLKFLECQTQLASIAGSGFFGRFHRSPNCSFLPSPGSEFSQSSGIRHLMHSPPHPACAVPQSREVT